MMGDARVVGCPTEILEVLAFYANPETYHGMAYRFGRPTGGFDSDIKADHGHPQYDEPMPGSRARAALRAALPSQRQGADSPTGATIDPSADQDHAASRNNAIQTVGALQEATATPSVQSAPATPCHCYDHCEDDDEGVERRPDCRKRDAPSSADTVSNVECPFCKERHADAVSLSRHLASEMCEEYAAARRAAIDADRSRLDINNPAHHAAIGMAYALSESNYPCAGVTTPAPFASTSVTTVAGGAPERPTTDGAGPRRANPAGLKELYPTLDAMAEELADCITELCALKARQ